MVARGLTISLTEIGDRFIVHVGGELDFATEPALLDAVSPLLLSDRGRRDSARTIVFDLAELTFCDSTGIGFFLRVAEAARLVGARIAIRNEQPAVRRVFETSDVDRRLLIGDEGLESTG